MRLEIKKNEIKEYKEVKSGWKDRYGNNRTYIMMTSVIGRMIPLDESFADFDDAYKNDRIHEKNWKIWE